MKQFLISTLGFVGFAITSASAADMPVKVRAPTSPPAISTSWAGWYAGLNVGYGWGKTTGTLTNFPNIFGIPAAVAGGYIPSNLGVKPAGVLGGGQFGYNWQKGQWVWGLEADFQGSGISDTNIVFFPGSGGFVPSTTTTTDKLEWFGTARARVGWTPTSSVLLYGTGGLAYGEVHETHTLNGTPFAAGSFAGSASKARAGWAAGAGGEWMFAPRWSVRAEYLHIDLGNTTVRTFDSTGLFPGAFADYQFKHEYEIARVALNYQFGAAK